MKHLLVFLLLVLVFTYAEDTKAVSVEEQTSPALNETEGAVEDVILSSNGTDVLTTTAEYFANHTQTQVQSTSVSSSIFYG
jgi:hypothetical protein